MMRIRKLEQWLAELELGRGVDRAAEVRIVVSERAWSGPKDGTQWAGLEV